MSNDGCQCGAYGAGVNGYHSRGAPLCSWTKLEESLKKQANPTPIGPECFGGSDYPETTDHYAEVLARIASKPNHVSPLCECGQPLNKHSIDGQYDGGCWESRCDGFVDARVVDSAPLPTQLTQPTGRRASSIACVYIAGPFSGSDGWEISENVHAAEKLAREVARLGAMPMTPHSIGAHMAGTESQTFWLAATLEMMRRCDAVLFTDDWRRSAGARGENAEAVRLGMPCFESLSGLRGWLSRRGGGA